jgi:hypothetical protein
MADFYEGLCDAQLLALKAASEEIAKLRGEVKTLRALLKDHDPQFWEMAEQICALQLRLLSLTPCEHGLDSRQCGLCDDERRSMDRTTKEIG